MVSDSEIIDRLHEFLRNSDLNTTTTAIVRRQLERDFGIDLSDKKPFIREQVDLFLQTQVKEERDGDDEEEADNQTTAVKSDVADVSNLEDDEEGDETEEASNGKGTKKRGSKKLDKEVKKRGGGFTKVCALSPQLQEFLGVPELARTEVVKQLWGYIKKKDLQDPNNRKNIICDEALHSLFAVSSINMFQMNKVLSKHIWPLESNDVVPVKSMQKDKHRKQKREEEPDESNTDKKQKGEGKSGILAPLPISDALKEFCGSGESKLARGDVVKKMWDYIKENKLQDPSDKRWIICDEKLKELFDVERFHGFTIAKLLKAHFIKPEEP